MASPLVWPFKTFFYPVGNTPAVCLTQDLPPGQSADVLLLGCGDARNVLYTVYADLPVPSGEVSLNDGPRKLDFTCCDYQPAILARNILLYVLIAENEPIDQIWNVYYHFFFDDSSLSVLVKHCNVLLAESSTVDHWHHGKYGSWLKFLDSHTLWEVRRYWQSYVNFRSVDSRKAAHLRKQYQKLAERNTGDTENISASRATGPLIIHAIETMSKLYSQFWESGTTFVRAKDVRLARLINPTFVYSIEGEKFEPHYGTFPIQNFHLAEAFAAGSSGASPVGSAQRVLDVAKGQFSAWCARFRQAVRAQGSPSVVIRFYTGDAIAFCSGLSHFSRTGDPMAPLYATAWHGRPVHLDCIDSTNSHASFDAIDTSNLTDHLGLLNILLVAEPLLKNGPDCCPVLYTESLIATGRHAAHSFLERLCGDPQLMAILIGLAPRPYLTAYSTTSHSHELMMRGFAGSPSVAQYHERVPWVRPAGGDGSRLPGSGGTLRLRGVSGVADIGSLFFEIYDRMLAYERNGMAELFRLMSNQSSEDMITDYMEKQNIRYTRKSFALLLAHIKDRVEFSDDEWTQAVDLFMEKVERDTRRLIGMNFYQDLCLQLHSHGLYTPRWLRQDWTDMPESQSMPAGIFPGWPRIPPILCVVLTVPCRALRPLLDRTGNVDSSTKPSPILLLQLNAGGGLSNTFSSLNAVPGELDVSSDPPTLKTEGQFTDATTFVFCCWIPAAVLTFPRTSVHLVIQNTPYNVGEYISELDPTLSLYSARLSDKNSVRVLRCLPNITSPPPVQTTARHSPPSTSSPADSLHVNVNIADLGISSLTVRCDVHDERSRSDLAQGAAVTSIVAGPCTVEVSIGSHKRLLCYPYPVIGEQRKLRIARKSSYVEVVASPSGPLSSGGYLFHPFPVLQRQSPFSWGMRTINLDILPALDIRDETILQWLNPHVSFQFSDRERALRESGAGQSDVLMNVKDSIHCILLSFVGLDPYKDRPRAFGLSDPDGGGVHTLLFVDKLRLDLSAFTVVADVAVLPLEHSLMLRLRAGLQTLTNHGLRTVNTRGPETVAWRKLLPAMVERCRTWQHKEDCQYRTGAASSDHTSIPISLEMGEPCLCACGRSVNLETLRNLEALPSWKYFRPFATRAALAPLFAVSYVEAVAGSLGRAVKEVRDRHRPASGLTEKCRSCGGVGKPDLLVCGRCKGVKYCSSECQRKDWKGHKAVCAA
ncbi:hypothetical protein OE88DRAFT_1694901 [Heliocybe sulcata]|uniref:MYND-type domain-containing protein n=1 Tax=Heliocybe sulcata TaxID=5364 RepID=A0A5C3ND32_9AGAM|nr:hypothetical protein OE88DRAFT_1694901 [Heliocybe sulcata]